jgi:hypothetical protein
MAIRYSGDVEVRLGWDSRRKIYRGSVRDPYKRWRGEVPQRWLHSREPRCPAAYDDAATRMIHEAERDVGHLEANRKHGQVTILRVFQSPCPAARH